VPIPPCQCQRHARRQAPARTGRSALSLPQSRCRRNGHGFGDMRVFPAYLQGGCAYRPYSPDSRRGSGTARAAQRHAAIQPSTAARAWHRQRQNPDWVTERLTPGQSPVRRTAPGSSRGGPVRRQARRAAPRRNPAPERCSAPVRPAPDGHHRRAEPAVSERATLASGRGSWEWTRPPGQPARLDYLQMRQQSLAGMALQEGRVVTRWQESRDR